MRARRTRWLLPTLALAVGVVAATVLTPVANADDRLPDCPGIFTHGGYPEVKPDAWKRDQVRQPNNPKALQTYKDMGSMGVESDIQLTKNGHKAVMWHNGSTYWLTGSKKDVTDIWWNTGADKLSGRTIEVGPFKGETVYTLRQFLDSLYDKKMVPLLELKGSTVQSLMNSDSAIREGAWKEVIDPIAERIDRQEIMIYTHDETLKPELTKRFTDAGLTAAFPSDGRGPAWKDTVPWEEPPPSADGNHDSWQAALADNPKRMATDWPKELSAWLKGKCQ